MISHGRPELHELSDKRARLKTEHFDSLASTSTIDTFAPAGNASTVLGVGDVASSWPGSSEAAELALKVVLNPQELVAELHGFLGALPAQLAEADGPAHTIHATAFLGLLPVDVDVRIFGNPLEATSVAVFSRPPRSDVIRHHRLVRRAAAWLAARGRSVDFEGVPPFDGEPLDVDLGDLMEEDDAWETRVDTLLTDLTSGHRGLQQEAAVALAEMAQSEPHCREHLGGALCSRAQAVGALLGEPPIRGLKWASAVELQYPVARLLRTLAESEAGSQMRAPFWQMLVLLLVRCEDQLPQLVSEELSRTVSALQQASCER